MSQSEAVISPEYDSAIRTSLKMQLITGVLALLVLDGRVTARVAGVAMIGFWLSAAVLIAVRPRKPSRIDLWWITWGFWPVLLIALLRQFLS